MKPLAWLLTAVLLAVVFGFMGHALWQMGGLRELTGGSWVLTLIIVGAVVVTGLVAAVLMRLAFWSSKKGWDDQVTFEERKGDDGGA